MGVFTTMVGRVAALMVVIELALVSAQSPELQAAMDADYAKVKAQAEARVASSPRDLLASEHMLGAGIDGGDMELDLSMDDDEEPLPPRRRLQSVDLASLNSYLGDQRFGANPGPCPDFGERCTTDVQDMPEYIARTPVTLSVLWFDFTNSLGNHPRRGSESCKINGSGATAGKCEGWAADGDVDAWKLWLYNIGVGSISVSTGAVSTTQYNFNFDMDDLSLGAGADYRMREIEVGMGAFPSIVRNPRSWGCPICLGFGNRYDFGNTDNTPQKYLVLNQNSLNRDPNGKIDLFMRMRLSSKSGFNFNNDMPYTVDFIPGNGDNGCEFNIALSDDTIQFPRGVGYDILGIDIGGLLRFFVGLIRGIIASAVCSSVVSSAFLYVGGVKSSTPGPLNEALRAAYDDIHVYIDPGVRTNADVITGELDMLAANPVEADKAINFNNNSYFDYLQAGLNDLLGDISTSEGYENTLVINELVDLLLGDRTGVFDVPDPSNPTSYTTFDADTFYGEAELEPVVFGLRLNSYRLQGINTFTNNFKVASNLVGSDPRNHTLHNEFTLRELQVDADWTLTMRPGVWVTSGQNKRATFTFSTGVFLRDIFLKSFTNLLMNLRELDDEYLGHLFDTAEGEFDKAVDCAMQVVYKADLALFQVAIGSFSKPVLSNFGAGLVSVVSNMVNIAFTTLKGMFSVQMPAISDNLFRPELNVGIQEYLDELPTQCWDFQPKSARDIIDLDDNTVAALVNDGLNNAVGGNPVTISSVDINALIHFYVTRYADRISAAIMGDEVELASPGIGTWTVDLKTNSDFYDPARPREIGRFTSEADVGMVPSTLSFGDLTFSGVHSIHKLQLSPMNRREERVLMSIGGQGTLQDGADSGRFVNRGPVTIEFKLGGQVCRDGDCSLEVLADDEAFFRLEFDFEVDATIYAEMDNNRLMQLRFADLEYPTCALASLGNSADEEKGRYWFNELDLLTTRFFTDVRPATTYSSSRMGQALNNLDFALSSGEPHVITTFQVRYLMRRAADYFKEVVRDSAEKNKIPIDGCQDFEYELDADALNAFFVLQPPSIDEGFFAEQPIVKYWPYSGPESDPSRIEIKRSTEWEEEVMERLPPGHEIFDLRGNPIVEELRANINSQNTDVGIRALANSSFFSNYLKLREDDSVDLEIDLNATFGTVANDDIVEGFKLIPGVFTLTKVEAAEFEFFREYDQYAAFTTSHYAKFNFPVNATISFTVETDGSFIGQAEGTVVREVVYIDFQVDNLDFDIVTYLGVDLTELELLAIDDFVEVDSNQVFSLRQDAAACLGLAVVDDGFGIPGFQITYDNVRRATVRPGEGTASDLYTDEFAEFAGAALDAVVETYKRAAADITQGPGREMVDEYAKAFVRDAKNGVTCFDALAPPLEGDRVFFNFTDSEQVLELYEFTQSELLDPDSPYYINTIITAYTDTAFSEFSFPISSLPLSYNQQSFGEVRLNITNFRIDNLGTVDELTLLDYRPVANDYPGELQDYTTRTSIRTGSGANEVSVFLDFAIQVDDLFEDRPGLVADADGQLSRVQNDLHFELHMSEISLALDTVTKMDITKMLKIQLKSFLDLAEYPCFLEVFDEGGLSVEAFLLSLGQVRATMECIGVCNSPLLEGLDQGAVKESEELNSAITQGINDTLTILNLYLVSQDFKEVVDAELEFSEYNCISIGQAVDTAVEQESKVAVFMGIIGLSGMMAGLMGLAFLVPVHVRRRDQLMRAALLTNAKRGGQATPEEFMFADRRMRSCFTHPVVPKGVKWIVPVWIIVNIAMFVSANFFSVGAAVQVRIGLLGDTTKPLDLMAFTLESSIDDMWSAGTYFLAIIIALASGGWPYIKNVLLLFAWFAPATIISKQRRGGLLEVLDALGKWSLIDVYVLIMLTVAFRFYITTSYVSSITELFAEDVVIVDVVVTPGWGIYGFVFGALGSLFVNHLMIFWNRQIIAKDDDIRDKMLGTYVPETPTPRLAAHKHRFAATDASGRIYGFGPGTKVTVASMLVLSFGLILVGAVLPLMTFTFRGVTGILLSAIGGDLDSVTYSLATIAVAIVDGTDDDAATRLGILFLQVVYLLFALIVPLLLCIVFGLLWLYPLRAQEQRKLFFMAEILSAWEALLVFIASVVAAIFQISDLAQFIVRSSTGTLCANLEAFLIDRSVSATDARCFDVDATIEITGFVIILGSLLLVVTAFIVFRLVGPVIDDRIAMNKQRECINPRAHPKKSLRGFVLRFMTVPVARINIRGAGANNGGAREAQVATFVRQDSDMSSSGMFYDGASMASRSASNPIFGDSDASSAKISPNIDV